MLDPLAFGALVKRKRGEAKLTQETLAGDVFGDPGRKADISRIENGKVTPQEATIQRLCTALAISTAEMEPIRQGRSIAGQLDHIPALSRQQMEDMAARFGIENPYDRGDQELRDLLTDKAEDWRALKRQIAALDDRHAQIAELKGSAEAAAEAGDLEQVDQLLGAADVAETKISADTKIARAQNALTRNRTQQAYEILSAVADSFGSVDAMAPAMMRGQLYKMLYDHGLRYGGVGLALAEDMLEEAARRLPEEVDEVAYLPVFGNLALVQKSHGVLLEGEAGRAKLEAAATTYRRLLSSLDPKSESWGITQNNLGNALKDQGIRAQGAEGQRLLSEAVEAYRRALEVRTREKTPAQWAMTQNNLGIALRNQGSRADGNEAIRLLSEAVVAYRRALEVRVKEKMPEAWAMTQNNLGITLSNQGTRAKGAASQRLLGEAVIAYRAALEVYTRDRMPVQWATTQNNLGATLRAQSSRVGGTEAQQLLGEAVQAYRAALEVQTRDNLPVPWATTQVNVGFALLERAQFLEEDLMAGDLQAALEAVDGALEVFDPEHTPYQHGNATGLRESILAAMAG
ncbi:MAG: helix-turn-helix domain-containing protein [Pseudomonadota bacterium]